MAASATPAVFGPDAAAKVLKALKNQSYVWRTLPGIEQETGLSEFEIMDTLKRLPDEEELVVSEAREGKPVYSTRSHYKQRQSVAGKLLSVLSGQIK